MINITSCNCNSVRSNLGNIQNIMKDSDVICLQELMLHKSDLHILDEINADFENIAFVKDRESQNIVEGRPFIIF